MTEEEKYEKRRAFAGERKPSMLRRCVGHDYTERRMYMVTMVTEGRRAADHHPADPRPPLHRYQAGLRPRHRLHGAEGREEGVAVVGNHVLLVK